jgi:hypothetical protein
MQKKQILILNSFFLSNRNPFHKNTLTSILLCFVCFLALSQSLFAQSLAPGGGALSQDSYAISADGKVYAWGQSNSPAPADISGFGALAGKKIVSIAAGRNHKLALDSDGKVYTWGGYNNSSSPVEVPGLSGITAIAVGESHSLALKLDGTVYAWGAGGEGQLGTGLFQGQVSSFASSTPLLVGMSGVIAISAGFNHSMALKADGTVYFWGGSITAVPRKVNNLSGVIAVTSGYYHSLILKLDGTVYTMGNGNEPVQVNNLSGVTAIACGTSHSLALTADGTVYAWGWGSNGQLGIGTITDSSVPVQVNDLSGVMAIAGGLYHSLALKSDGTVYAWGGNQYGQLGNGTTTDSAVPVQVPILLQTSVTPTISLPSSMFYAGQNFMVGLRTNNHNKSGNYIAQLSNASGSFSSPVSIGTAIGYSTTYFQFNCTIPANTPLGSGYRIRVINSNSGMMVAEHAINLNISAPPASITWQVLEDFEQPNAWPWKPWSTPGDGGFVNGNLSASAAHSGQYGISGVSWAYRADVAIGKPGDKISMWVKNGADLGFQSAIVETHFFRIQGNTISFHYNPGYTDYPWRQVVAAESNSQPDKWYRLEVSFVERGWVEGRVYDSDGVTELAYLKSGYYYRGPAGIAMRGSSMDDISYYLAPQSSIVTSTLNGNTFCQGQTLAIPFAVTGFFNSGNTFTAQLSNAEGSFDSPTNLGTINGSMSGTISTLIPANIPAGAGYRIRVVSSSPMVIGADNGINLKINFAPTLSAISAPAAPVQLNSPISASATFTGTNPQNASWNWGDGRTSVAEINGSTISGNHTYTSPGVYTTTLTIQDACGNTVTSDYQYTVIYNPTGSFMAGSGFINSPAGALRGQSEVNGKAVFGFEAKYQKNVATGPGELLFQVGSFSFKSTSYEESITTISGNKAYYKGKGIIADRTGSFGFMVSVVDGQYNDGTGSDRFRVKIYELLANGGAGRTIYDNVLPTKKGEQPDNFDLTKDNSTIIGGGSILILNPTGKKSERVSDQADLATVDKVLTTYPNPFRHKTTIAFSFKQDEDYTLEVYDVKGILVKRLQAGKAKAGIMVEATWEPAKSAQGIYILRLMTPHGVQHMRVVQE